MKTKACIILCLLISFNAHAEQEVSREALCQQMVDTMPETLIGHSEIKAKEGGCSVNAERMIHNKDEFQAFKQQQLKECIEDTSVTEGEIKMVIYLMSTCTF